MPVNGV